MKTVTAITEEFKTQLFQALSSLKLDKLILFGSYAWGEPSADSDLDLYVVTQDDFIPADYSQKMQHYLSVSSLLRPLNRQFPIDLIVHTKPMHERFVQMDSQFARELMTKGVVWYEEGH